MSALKYFEISPKKPHEITIIWLHGLGANGYDFEPIIPKLQLIPNAKFIFPHAPLKNITVNNGSPLPAWYDILSFGAIDTEHNTDLNGIIASESLILELLEQEQKELPLNKIFLAGFSQGAVMSLFTGLRFPQNLGGIILLSGYLPLQDTFFKMVNPKTQTAIFLAHGTHDLLIPINIAKNTYSLLSKNHYSLTWHEYNMGHTICPQEIKDLAMWINVQYRKNS